MMSKTTATDRGQLGETFRRAAALCLLALAGLWCQATDARAQWTTTGTTTSTTNNVGIGTTTPNTAKLVISGTAGANGLDLSSTDQYAELRVIRNSLNPGDKDLYLQWQAGAGSKIHFYSNNAETMTLNGGNVGVGTATPGILNGFNYAGYIPLHIQRQGAMSASVVVDTAVPASGYVINDSSQPVDNRIWAVSQGAGGGKLTFASYTDAGAPTNRVVLDRSGNMGIGTTTPASRLHVAGDITVDGNINAKYQDVAEWVPTTQKLSAGMVVVVDAKGSNRVLASAAAYDTRVAGVISAQPGITLGEASENKALVATTGRVKVKVDATRLPIRAGDLLVTSDVEGVAMRSEPVSLGGIMIHRPGTIIGKALESLDKGTGEILVLLSLQ
jgi:hypothetical protein